MNITARASFIHQSPRKLRLVAKAVRGLTPKEAIARLKTLPQRAAGDLLDVYQQALGNAKNHSQISLGDLKVASLQIEEGPSIAKKADVHAHGARFDRGVRSKKLSHIKIILEESKEEVKTNGPKS